MKTQLLTTAAAILTTLTTFAQGTGSGSLSFTTVGATQDKHGPGFNLGTGSEWSTGSRRQGPDLL